MDISYNDRVTDGDELEIMRQVSEGTYEDLYAGKAQYSRQSLCPAPIKTKRSPAIFRTIMKGLESLF
ncbi:hypothetical protein K8R33_00275 [archaeon]|nr:hypothetical protein [archaeon]